MTKETRIDALIVALGLSSGLLLGTNQLGSGILVAIAASACAWLYRANSS
jgi:hypothetical protein